MQHFFLPFCSFDQIGVKSVFFFHLYDLDLKTISFTFYNAEKILKLACETFCNRDLQGIV